MKLKYENYFLQMLDIDKPIPRSNFTKCYEKQHFNLEFCVGCFYPIIYAFCTFELVTNIYSRISKFIRSTVHVRQVFTQTAMCVFDN